jgi:hypothetical protein
MDKKQLARKWTHAFEEDNDTGVQVFRPSEGTFPRSRGREKIDLTAVAGKRTKIGADDVYVDVEGEWSFDEGSETLTFTSKESNVPTACYDVLEMTDDKLVLKRQLLQK